MVFRLKSKLISSILIPVASIFLAALAAITWFWIENETSALDASNKRYAQEYIEARKAELRNEVLRVRAIIQDERNLAEIRLQQQLKARVYQAWNAVDSLRLEYEDLLSTSEIQQKAIESLRYLRWENGQRYFYILTLNGIELLYPPDPFMENRHVQDAFGTMGGDVYKLISTTVKRAGEGPVNYRWRSLGENSPLQNKPGYVKLYQPWNWIIGTGSLGSDFEETFRQDLFQKIAQTRPVQDDNGYFFLISYSGEIHAARHRYFADAPNMLHAVNSQGTQVIQKNIDIAQQSPEGGFSRYIWPDETGTEVEKLSFVLAIDELETVIGTGIYLDKLHAEIAAREAELQQKLRARIETLLAIVALALTTVALSVYWLVLKLRENMRLFQRTFADSINSRVHIDARNIHFDEFKLLAHQANTMIDGLNMQAEELRHRAYHDHLTGLPNRMYGTRHLSEVIDAARSQNRRVGLLFIDLDNFKEVNDTLGHSAGDLLLKMVASRLRSLAQPDDMVARLGGDEFTIITPLGAADLRQTQLAEQVLAVFQQPFTLNNQQIHVTASIGLSIYPENGHSAELLLRNADSAMYRAKGDGKNGYSLYNRAMTDEVVNRLATVEAMREALEQEQFVLFFQPQIDTCNGQVIGAEALIRWAHPQRGIIAPGQFIGVAESSGQIAAIGEWVLREACRNIVSWRDAGVELPRISINISGHQMRDGKLVETLTTILRSTGCPASSLELEITESVLMDNPEAANHLLSALQSLGCRIAIDDFGTGYSSLSYLKRLPIDKLKIDRSFIDELHLDGHDQAITRAIIALAQSLRLEVIAEGVENIEQLNRLRELGCHQVQGYHFSRPLPEPDFLQFIEDAAAELSHEDIFIEFDARL